MGRLRIKKVQISRIMTAYRNQILLVFSFCSGKPLNGNFAQPLKHIFLISRPASLEYS